MKRLVSIVIPAFNRGFVISAALESILNQTYQDWEALVVNDGSTDDTSEVVKGYMRKDSRIRLIEQDRQRGAQAARNIGIRNALGMWIAFLDSDDRWLPHSLEARLKLTQEGLHHVVHSDCYIQSSGSNELELFGVPPMQGQIYKELLQRPGPMFQGLLVSKEALSRIGLLDEKIVSYQEWDTAIRFGKHYEFGFVLEPTFLYDCRHAGTISKDLLRVAVGYEQVFTKHFWSVFRFLGLNALAWHYQTAAGLYSQAGDENNAHRCLRRASLFSHLRPRTTLSRVQRLIRSGL
jgi:glycosyltransferase involved in cell wall biosynthesis